MNVWTKSNFQVFALFFLALTASADWCADSCTEAKATLITKSTADDLLATEGASLATKICVGNYDADICRAQVPAFWTAIAKTVFPVAWSNLCADITPETCDAKPTCSECTTRVNSILTYMKTPPMSEYWVKTLNENSFCRDNYPAEGITDVCKKWIPEIVPVALPMMAENYWVDEFCTDFQCSLASPLSGQILLIVLAMVSAFHFY